MKAGILVALAMLPVATPAVDTADISSGAIELSGDAQLGFSQSSTKVNLDVPGGYEEKFSTEGPRIDVGAFYYVVRNVGLGLSVSYAKSREEEEAPGSDTITNTSTLLIGPAISLQLPVASSLALFARAAGGYASAETSVTGIPDIKMSGYGFAVQGGVKYFPVAQVSIDVGLAYTYTSMTSAASASLPKVTADGSAANLSAGLSVYFGR